MSSREKQTRFRWQRLVDKSVGTINITTRRIELNQSRRDGFLSVTRRRAALKHAVPCSAVRCYVCHPRNGRLGTQRTVERPEHRGDTRSTKRSGLYSPLAVIHTRTGVLLLTYTPLQTQWCTLRYKKNVKQKSSPSQRYQTDLST